MISILGVVVRTGTSPRNRIYFLSVMLLLVERAREMLLAIRVLLSYSAVAGLVQ